jgi:hypothetical protein
MVDTVPGGPEVLIDGALRTAPFLDETSGGREHKDMLLLLLLLFLLLWQHKQHPLAKALK